MSAQKPKELGGCRSGSDGECSWRYCPQFKDYKTYCPRAVVDERNHGEMVSRYPGVTYDSRGRAR